MGTNMHTLTCTHLCEMERWGGERNMHTLTCTNVGEIERGERIRGRKGPSSAEKI